jgi:hypothetical protein
MVQRVLLFVLPFASHNTHTQLSLSLSRTYCTMQDKVDTLVLPGDVIGRLSDAGDVVRLGLGLFQDNELVVASKAGMLRFRAPNKFWIESSQRRVRTYHASSQA